MKAASLGVIPGLAVFASIYFMEKYVWYYNFSRVVMF